MALNERAVLVSLSISSWTARKFDKKVTATVAYQHSTSSSVGNYNKNLLPDGDSLSAITKFDAVIRSTFAANTLPWGLKGTALLPSANFVDYMNTFRSQRIERERLVSTFLNEYPYLRHRAQNSLKGLFDINDYPSPDAIGYKFGIDLAVTPVPENDFRVQLSSDEIDIMKSDLESRMKEASQHAMQEMWDRLYASVSRMVDRLSNPEGRIHDSLVTDVQELCALLPKLNFTDDPDLEAMRQQVERKLASNDPDLLRHNRGHRQDTADEAARILKQMSGFMGGPVN